MKQKFITGLLIALLATTFSFAQNIEITGRIVHSEKDTLQPLPNASIVLLHQDSSLAKGAVATAAGIFNIKNITKGNYILMVSAVGFADYFVTLNNLNRTLELGEIVLQHTANLLQEVVIEGSHVVQKIDRSLYYPLPSQVKKSNNAYDLLRHLMIPRLYVDPRQQRLEASGGSGVQIRINNAPANTNDLSGILAKDILRVEYLENPGNRYGVDLGGVINIITKKREDGGQIAGRFSNAMKIFWGENFLSGKYNYRKSQWTVAYTGINRGANRNRNDAHELYSFPGYTIERFQIGIPDKYKSHSHSFDVAYNLSDPDKYVFNAVFRNNISIMPFAYSRYKLFTTGSADTLLSKTFSKSNSYSPSLDLYFQKSLSKSRAIELNVVGTKISTAYERNYSETKPDENVVTDILRHVSGDKYSIITDANFDKEYKKVKMSVGIKHTFGATDNVYSGNTALQSVMSQAETRAYTEFTGKIKNVGYVIGTGLTRTYFRQGDYHSEYYTFTPLLRLNYNPNKYANLRYSFDVTPRIPSLSSLTDVELMIDTIQNFRGNPKLKVYNVFSNSIMYSLNYKKLRSSVLAKYQYYHRPVMEDYFAEGNKIINTENNQKAFGSFNAELNVGMSDLKLFGIPDFISFYAALGYLNYNSLGNNYTHTYNDVYYNFGVSFSYRNVELGFEQRKWKSTLLGETIRRADRGLTLLASYRIKRLDIGMMMFDPFGLNKYPGSDRLSSVARIDTRTYPEEFVRLLVARVVYNIEFGKAYKTRRKNKSNADTETGIVK